MRLSLYRIILVTLITLWIGGGSTFLYAHTLAPVLLTVELSGDHELRAVWSFSRDAGAIDPNLLSLQLAEGCSPSITPSLIDGDRRWIRQEQYLCSGGTKPLQLAIQGLQQLETTVALRIIGLSDEDQIHMLDRDQNAPVFEDKQQNRPLSYLPLGIEHIIGGIDHLLFVIALFFVAGGVLRRLFWLITAFTLAHSITLSAAALGWVYMPSRPVEALIALSIALVAADLVAGDERKVKTLKRYWPIVFIFGLLHGLGFAGALAEIGLPENAMVGALLAFNLGVELGQLLVLLVCAVLVALVRRVVKTDSLQQLAGYCIGSVAGFWFVERVVWILL